MNTVCYTPVRGVDDVIASQVQGWTPHKVATLRGMYDEVNPTKNLDTSDPATAAETLVNFRKSQIAERQNQIKSAGTNVSEAYRQVKEQFSAEERFDRVNMISYMFSQAIDNIQMANSGLSREAIANGITSDGRKVAGEFSIFEYVYNNLLERYEYLGTNGRTEEAAKIKKVLNNWPALVTFARIRLRDTEGLKLGNKVEAAKESTPEDFEEQKLAEMYTPEESKREGWQELTDHTSAFGTVGKEVRRLLGSLQKIQNGVVQRDDLGFPKMLDPVKSHQALLEILRGVTSEAQMMNMLRKEAARQEWLNPVIAALNVPSNWRTFSEREQATFMKAMALKTKFFRDFKKNFQPYVILLEAFERGVRTFKTKVINRTNTDSVFNQFITRTILGKALNPAVSMFDAKGNVNWTNVQKFRQLVNEYLPKTEKANINDPLNVKGEKKVWTPDKFYDKKQTDRITQKKRLSEMLEAIGVEVDSTTLDAILSSPKDLRYLTNQFKELVEFGIDRPLTVQDIKTLESGGTLNQMSYKDFINRKPAGENQKKPVFKEKIEKALTIVVKHREGLRLESRGRHIDRKGKGVTLFSNVLPSYLGDMIDKIGSYVENNQSAELKTFLEQHYLDSPFFKYEGKILNRWIKDLYESDLSDEKSFANNFQFQRFSGTADNNFENFTSKQHAVSMMMMYFSEKQVSAGSSYAWYPVFILGDSGVSKYIKAKRYTSNEILEGMLDVYKQELRRMALTEAANKHLAEEGISKTGQPYSPIENFSKKGNEFTTLSFLNSTFKTKDGKIGKYAAMLSSQPTDGEVKDAIKAYMADQVAEFTGNIEGLGLLNEVNGVSEYFSQEFGKGKTKEQVLADYYWNTKFATIQQLQMFTIDPAFYNGTKDLQKRYKEIHAPGNILSPYASWNGEYFAGTRIVTDTVTGRASIVPDDIERVIYFNDININGEDVDTEFMQAILLNYAKVPEGDVLEAISKGVLNPRQDEQEETQRIKTLQGLLGENWAIYKKYQKNTLTDGQGYRTLHSYRKVMGMAGQWNEDMENAYNQINELRQKYGKDSVIPASELQKIADLSVIFKPIKPYLYTIENLAVNDKDEKLKIPVQHKYAEAVLIPELLPLNSKLRSMAYWMEEYRGEDGSVGIDMVCSTKVVKVGNFGATDIANIKDSTSLGEALGKGYVHQLSYNDYRIQTNVPDHINSSQLFGTQVRKLIMANIDMYGNSDYSGYTNGNIPKLYENSNNKVNKLTGANLVSFYNSLIVANILESFDEFKGSVSDANKLSDALLQNTVNNSRESMDNLLAFSLTGDDFSIPLFEGGLEHDAASLLFSIFKKKVNKQKIKGGSAVQVSAMGIKEYEEDGGLRYITDPNNPKNILYAEAEIPFNLSYTDNSGNVIDLKFEDYCNEDGTLKTDESGQSLIEKKFPGILDIVAYRIPTERDYSMINIKVVRFSHKTAGGTIKVPVQGSTIAGFDFDIDKLYFMRYEFSQKKLNQEQIADIWNRIYESNPEIKEALLQAREDSLKGNDIVSHLFRMFGNSELAKDVAETTIQKERLYKYWEEAGLEGTPEQVFSDYLEEHADDYLQFDEYDYSKTPLNNSKAARNNMLIQIISKRLTDPATFKERYTPGGFTNASKAARVMRELMFGDLGGIVDGNQVDFNAINERAKDETTDPEPNYDPSDPWTIIVYNQQNQVAGKLIGIFANQNTNHAFASLMKSFSLNKPIAFGSYASTGLKDFLNGPTGVDVDLNVAELLAASVDAVKDPVLNFMNLNTFTADAGAVLSRLGYSTVEIGLLFNQPIIIDICNYAFHNGVELDIAVTEVMNIYQKDLLEKPTVASTSDYTTNVMAMNIITGRRLRERKETQLPAEFIQSQLKMAKLFSQVKAAADDVTQFISATKFTASNAVGSTFGELYAQQMRVSKYLEKFTEDNKQTLTVEMRVTETIDTPVNDSTRSLQMSNQEYIESLVSNPFAYEQAMFDMNRKTLRLLSKYFPYETSTYSGMRERLASLTRSGLLNDETINTAHNDLMTYMMNSVEDSEFFGEGIIRLSETETTTNREYYTQMFPKQLFDFLESRPDIKALPLFQHIQIETIETKDKKTLTEVKVQDIGGLQPYQKDELRENWAELMRTEPELAKALFMYNFYKLGFTFGPGSFMNLAPTEVKQAIKVGKRYNATTQSWEDRSYIDFLKEVKNGTIAVANPDDFAKQFILNHLDNNRLVYNVKGTPLRFLKEMKYYKKGLEIQSSFELDVSKLGQSAKAFTLEIKDGVKGDREVAFRPVLVIENDLIYVAQGDGSKFNYGKNGKITYVLVNKQGVSNVSLQYKSSAEASVNTDFESKAPIWGNSSIETEPIVPVKVDETFDRDALIDELINTAVQVYLVNGSIVAEQVEEFTKQLKAEIAGATDQDIVDNIATIREEAKKLGVTDKITGKKGC